jgi:hypothetical protein
MRLTQAAAGFALLGGLGLVHGCTHCKVDTAEEFLELDVAPEDRPAFTNDDGSDDLSAMSQLCREHTPGRLGLAEVGRCPGDEGELDCVACRYAGECY